MDEIVRAVAAGGFIKLAAISARDMVARARQIHQSSAVATAALGRTLCATSMLGDMLKGEEETVTVRINGGGPVGTIICVSDWQGNARGYIQNPEATVPNKRPGKLNVGAAVGTDGMLTVSRDLGLKEPYVGSTALVSGEIAEDFAAYFVESDQVGTACGLGVLAGPELSVLAAGGFIAQLMPGADDALIDLLEKNIAALGQVTTALVEHDLDYIVCKVLEGLAPEILSRAPVEYRCGCSSERVAAAIMSMGEAELQDIVQRGADTEVTCQFCDTRYRFTTEDVAQLLMQLHEQA